MNSGTATVEQNIISGNAATVAAGRPLSFKWAFGDGPSLVVGPSSVVSHVYLTVGLYTAVVTASNHVSSATASTPVIIVPPYRLYLPLVLRF